MGFYVQVSGGTVEQLRIQDGAIVPVTNNDIDLGTSSLEFKDLFLDGTAHIDTLDVDVNATVAGTLGVTGATTLSSTLGVTGAITGSSTLQATTITATTAFVPDASDGASLGTTSLEFSDLFLADGALIAFGNDQDVTITHLADAGLLLNGARGLFFNDTTQYINAPNGTTLDIAATDEIELNATLIDINGAADVSGNLAVGGNLTVTGNATIAGNLTFGDAATDTVAFSADVASNLLPSVDNTYDLGAAGSEWKDLYIDGTANIDSLVADTADINGGTIDGVTIGGSSAGDITYANLSDGTITITAFADEDDMSSDSATLVPTQQSVKAYVDAQVTAQDLDIVGDTGTDAIDLDSETITFTGGTGITSVVTTGTVTHNIDSTVATLTGSQTLTNKSLTAPTLTGTAIVASLDISGDIDVDGTTNLDVVDIDGAVDFGSTTAHAGNATFADNAKAIFGAGSDLQIYHSGSHSIIADVGTGDLLLRGNNARLQNSDGSSTFIHGFNAGAVDINYAGNTKLATTATGIDVTGTVTADGLTVDTDAYRRLLLTYPDNFTSKLQVGFSNFYVQSSATNDRLTIANNSSGQTHFENQSKTSMVIDNSGDISFYEDTGTTPKFFWDASAERLGLGTTTPAGNLHIEQSGTNPYIRITETGNTGIDFGQETNGNGIINLRDSADLRVFTSATERLRIDSAGNVGIGTNSPDTALHVVGLGSTYIKSERTASGSEGHIIVGAATSKNEIVSRDATTGNKDLTFTIGTSERMRISGAEVYVGHTGGTAPWAMTGSAFGISLMGSGGFIGAARSGAEPLLLNRTSSDGAIINLRKDGTTVGSIGVGNSNDLTIGTADTGLVFQDNERISPWNPSTNSLRDDAIDFGDIDRRFKDLYLSGTVALTTADKASAANMFVSPSTDFLYLEHPANGMIFRNTAGTEAMRIDSSGNVGIGTLPTNVSGYKTLNVGAGTIGSIIKLDGASTGHYHRILNNNGQLFIQADQGNSTGNSAIVFGVDATERMRIDSSGNVRMGDNGSNPTDTDADNLIVANASGAAGIQITTASSSVGKLIFGDAGNARSGMIYYSHISNFMRFDTVATEAMRINSSGNLLVGTTSNSVYNDASGTGIALNAGEIQIAGTGATLYLNRQGSYGTIAEFRKDGTTGVGSIGSAARGASTGLFLNSEATGSLQVAGVDEYMWDGNQFYPYADNANDLGFISFRWDDIYATNGTIQTSDRNEKQDIAELSDAEQRVAVACKGLLRKFRWKSKVEEKGDDARIHFGIIAQDLQAAFEAEGLDAGRYAMFIHSTWTDEETGEERSRMGVRYSELLAFIIATI